MITAKHVLLDNNNELITHFYVRLNTTDKRSEYVEVKLEKSKVLLHEDENVDLAVLLFTYSHEVADYLPIPMNLVMDKSLKGLNEGVEVFFPGLFYHYTGENLIYPILRFGHLSTVSNEKIKVELGNIRMESDFYLIECTSFRGNSGSPVFFKKSTDPWGSYSYILGGIITGSYHESQMIHSDTILKQNTGIAFITPAYKLLEILNSEKGYKDRNSIK